MKEFLVAISQLDLKLGDKVANLKKAGKFIAAASAKGADVICFPEYLTTGYVKEGFAKLAEPIPGPGLKQLQSAAAEHGVYVVASMAERSGGELYNAAILVGPDGNLAKYRKVHLFADESSHFRGGDGYHVADTEFGKVGLMVCYDAIFPEVARTLCLKGAEVIFVPANWMNPFSPQWRLATSARALDNQVWIVATNRVGADVMYTYFGQSRVVDPYGNVVVECGDEEEMMVAKIEPSKSDEFKGIINFLRDRKPKTYG